MGVVDGDISMQGLHICVLQSLYLELVLHVGSVYRSQMELRSRFGQGQFHIPSQTKKQGHAPPNLSRPKITQHGPPPLRCLMPALWGLQPP